MNRRISEELLVEIYQLLLLLIKVYKVLQKKSEVLVGKLKIYLNILGYLIYSNKGRKLNFGVIAGTLSLLMEINSKFLIL